MIDHVSIGKIFIAAGTVLGFFPQFSAESGFLIQLGTDLIAGGGTVGPIRFGDESITATIGPWKA